MIYELTFTSDEFENFPEITMEDIVVQKFQDVHGISVDATMLALDENGFIKNEFGPDWVKIVIDDGVEVAALSIEPLASQPLARVQPSIWRIDLWVKKAVSTLWRKIKGLFS